MGMAKDFAAMIAMLLMAGIIVSASSHTPATKTEREYWVYVGTAMYNDSPTKTLYGCRFNTRTGALKLVGVTAETPNPGFIAVHPSGQFLYAVNELGEYQGKKNGAISAFRIDHTSGILTLLNQVPTLGANPAYVTMSRTGKFVLFASYYGGVVVRPIRDDGSLGDPTASLQMGVAADSPHLESSHPHAVVLPPDERFAVVPDLGLNRIFSFRFDANSGALVANRPAILAGKSGLGSAASRIHAKRAFRLQQQ